MHILYESACIIGYCICWVVAEWSVCIVVLQVVGLWLSGLYVLWSCRCVDFGEVVSCVHYANASTFIVWFDDNELVIFEVVQCCFFL